MATTSDISNDFISQFHNLAGDLIGERKHNLYKLIQNTTTIFSNKQQCCETLKNIQPKTYLESLFKVDLLIYFKRTEDLTEILKEGNEVFISKILKQPWYFQEAFGSMDALTLTNEFLPCMSYAMRMKLLKRISNSWAEEKMDTLFDALYDKYGLHVATSVFHTCSESKIKQGLKDNEICFRPNQVKHLFNKNNSLFEFYINYYGRLKKACYDEEKVLQYVALKNPALLLQLQKEKKVMFNRVGRRTSKKIVDLVKQEIPKDFDRYTKLLNQSVVVRRLGSEFRTLYLNSFPRTLVSIESRNPCSNLMTLYPKKLRWGLFESTFKQVFPDSTIDEAITNLSDSLFKLCPSKEIIRKWAEIKYKLDTKHNEKYLKYLEPWKAVPLIKEKINVTSDIYQRKKLVLLLVETCGENNDLTTLEDVLKYICTRHRNEESDFRSELYNTLSSSVNLGMLKENHWKYINEQLKLDRARKELRFWQVKELIWKHLEFSLKNNKNYKTALIEYINDVVETGSNYSIKVHDLSIEKQVLSDVCKAFPEVVKIESERFEKLCSDLIKNVIEFSTCHPDHCINLTDFSYFVTFINNCLNRKEKFQEDSRLLDKVLNYNVTCPKNAFPIENAFLLQLLADFTAETDSFPQSAFKMFTKKQRSTFENQILELYFDKLFDENPSEKTVRWFLRNDPRAVVPYFEKIIKNGFTPFMYTRRKKSDLELYSLLKLYSHFDYDRKISELYKEKLHDEGCYDKNSIVKSLVVLLSTTEFIEVANDFRPKKPKLDVDDPEMQKIYKLQCEVAKILHRVQNPSKIIPLVMAFSVGDYLQSALPSLYGVFYKSPENLLYPFVDELSKSKAVSLKKHALFLSCEVLNRRTVSSLMQSVPVTNASDRKHKFSATLKYLLKSPSDELMAQVVDSLSAIDENDHETLTQLSQAVVPRKYRAMFFQRSWELYESLGGKGVQVVSYLTLLLSSLDADAVKSLPQAFVIDLISRYLPKPDSITGIQEFTIKILEQREVERSENFEAVFKILSRMWVKQVTSFFNAFIENPRDKSRGFIDMFQDYWHKHLLHKKWYFEELVALKLLKIHLDHAGDPKLYAESVVECLEGFVSEHGIHVLKIFADRLTYFMGDIEDSTPIFRNILLHKPTPNNAILVLEILRPFNKDVLEILKLVFGVEDLVVSSYLKKYVIDNGIEFDLSNGETL